MSQSVGLIACDNGLGHVRRCIRIAAALRAHDANATLFAPQPAVRRIAESIGMDESIDTVDFSTATSAENLRSGLPATADWEKRLPPLDGFDAIVCDNLPEVLDVRPDAVLSGNFLWHQAILDVHPDIRAKAERLIAACQPTMITYGPFGSDGLAGLLHPQPVAMFQSRRQVAAETRDALLVSCGRSGALRAETAALIGHIASRPQPNVGTVFVEPDLLPADPPAWMIGADYSLAMYDRLFAAVARPGMGTIGDCLASGVRIFAISEPDNLEMSENAQKIVQLGVGEDCADGVHAWSKAVEFLSDDGARRKHLQAVEQLEFGGADAAAVHILAQVDPSRPDPRIALDRDVDTGT